MLRSYTGIAQTDTVVYDRSMTDTLTVAAYCATVWTDTTTWTPDYTRPTRVELRSANYPTREDAEAFVALFPKSTKFRITFCDTPVTPGVYDGAHTRTWSAVSATVLAADDVNGGINETGVKRYRSTIARAAKAGVAVEWGFGGRAAFNAYPTREAFDAAI